MKQNIDDIIKQSETSKSVDLDPQLWQRLERRLDFNSVPDVDNNISHMSTSLGDRRRRRKKNSKMLFSRVMVAASFAAVFALVSALYMSASKYQVTDLEVQSRPYFTKDDVDGLNRYYPAMERNLEGPEEVG